MKGRVGVSLSGYLSAYNSSMSQETQCSVDGCPKQSYAKGMCRPHYNKNRLYGDPNYVRLSAAKVPCSVSMCDSIAVTRGLCEKHYTRWKRHRSVEDLEPRECEICGELFDPPGSRSFVCGKTECVRQRKLRNNRVAARNRKPTTRTANCAACGKEFTTQSKSRKYCSNACPARIKANWSRLRQALFDSDYAEVIEALRERTNIDAEGCWVWQGPYEQTGYPRVGFSKPVREGGPKIYLVHRLMLEAKLGRPIKNMHSHHTCANHGCVNPDHLELTTAAQNVGEMMGRKSYEARIRELEKALAQHDPNHPLLP